MRRSAFLLAVATLAVLSGCSIKRMAANSLANALSGGGDAYSRDDDPDLIRDAVPFGLKTMETVLDIVPRHRGLLRALCQGYTQYAYAFVQLDADRIEGLQYEEATRLRLRAMRLFVRARDYGLRGLELERPGITRRLQVHPDSAARELRARHVPALYWTAAAWGSAISVGRDQPDLTADIAVVKALIGRGLALDETYERGAFHEAMIVLESLPPAMGGSSARARMHFARAVELSGGAYPGPFVTLAQNVSVAEQNRAEFRDLLSRAVALDPERLPAHRLATVLLQARARDLMAREDELFLDPDTSAAEESP